MDKTARDFPDGNWKCQSCLYFQQHPEDESRDGGDGFCTYSAPHELVNVDWPPEVFAENRCRFWTTHDRSAP